MMSFDPGKTDTSSKSTASSLVYMAYKHGGVELTRAHFSDAVLEKELGGYADRSSHAGLFRFFDESIYLVHLLYMQAIFNVSASGNPCHQALPSLLFNVRQTACAVRTLQMYGLDLPSRLNLRFLRESLLCLCRAWRDIDFSEQYLSVKTFKEANEFWHRYLAKNRTEEYLSRHASESGKAAYLLSDEFQAVSDVLGAGAHPNFLGIQFDHSKYWRDPDDTALGLSKNSSEFVLSNATIMIFAAIAEVALAVSDTLTDIGPLEGNPMFAHVSGGAQASCFIGSSSMLMLLLLIKYVNRNRENFDPMVHF